MCDQQSQRSAHTTAKSDQQFCFSLPRWEPTLTLREHLRIHKTFIVDQAARL